jgi:hypothetical protein
MIEVIPHLMNQDKNNLQQLTACKKDAMATVTHIILQNTCAEVEYHLDIYHVTRNAKCTTKRF